MLTEQQIESFKEDYNIYKNLRKTSDTREELYKRISIRNWQTEEFNNLKGSILNYGVGNKNRKIYTIEISQNSYKMLAGYYEIDSGVVASFVLYDKNYTRYNYDGYAFLANVFDKVSVSSSVKNGTTYEIDLFFELVF